MIILISFLLRVLNVFHSFEIKTNSWATFKRKRPFGHFSRKIQWENDFSCQRLILSHISHFTDRLEMKIELCYSINFNNFLISKGILAEFATLKLQIINVSFMFQNSILV